MNKFPLILHFPVSRSKFYNRAVILAKKFNIYIQEDKINLVKMNVKEIFSKWDYFNLLFWRTVDWKGMILEWEGMEFHSHTDKTRIFYALQFAHNSYMHYLSNCIGQLYLVHKGECSWEEIKGGYTDEDMDKLVEYLDIKKIAEDVRKNQY